jgi:hypothetical protein
VVGTTSERSPPLLEVRHTHTHTHTADIDQMWPKMCPSSEALSHRGFQPNVAQNVPLVKGLCHAADFNQMWPKMCPSSEDFVTQRTLTKCGPNMCPSTGDFVLLWGLTTYGSTTYQSSKKAGTKQMNSNHGSTQN